MIMGYLDVYKYVSEGRGREHCAGSNKIVDFFVSL